MIKPVTTVRAPALPAQAISNAARQVLWLGPIGAGVALLIAIIGRVPSSSVDVPLWVVTIAAIALAIGIPHGAVDHLILRNRLSRQRLFWLGLAYLLIATAATIAMC